MSQRNRSKRVDNTVNHNEGWLIYNLPSMGETRDSAKELQLSIKAHGDNSDEVTNLIFRQFAGYIVDWNWIDDEGNPLPKPSDNWKVMEQLTNEEFTYIVELIKAKGQVEVERKK